MLQLTDHLFLFYFIFPRDNRINQSLSEIPKTQGILITDMSLLPFMVNISILSLAINCCHWASHTLGPHQWFVGKYLTTRLPARVGVEWGGREGKGSKRKEKGKKGRDGKKKKKSKSLFVAFADFCGIKTTIKADFKLLI